MEFIFENHMLVGLGIILVISFVGLIILQWIAEKTGVKTDKLQEGLKEVNETAQVEAAKELKKTVEKILTADEADEVIKMVKEGSLVELMLNAQGDIIYVEHSFAKEHNFDKDKMIEATFNPKSPKDKPLLITIPKGFSHNEEIAQAIQNIVPGGLYERKEPETREISIDSANGETQTFETGPDESVTILGKPKNKYSVRGGNGKFVKADGTTEKRKVGRPRKDKTSIESPSSVKVNAPLIKSAKDRPL